MSLSLAETLMRKCMHSTGKSRIPKASAFAPLVHVAKVDVVTTCLPLELRVGALSANVLLRKEMIRGFEQINCPSCFQKRHHKIESIFGYPTRPRREASESGSWEMPALVCSPACPLRGGGRAQTRTEPHFKIQRKDW